MIAKEFERKLIHMKEIISKKTEIVNESLRYLRKLRSKFQGVNPLEIFK